MMRELDEERGIAGRGRHRGQHRVNRRNVERKTIMPNLNSGLGKKLSAQ
jgi:hypothetical protein